MSKAKHTKIKLSKETPKVKLYKSKKSAIKDVEKIRDKTIIKDTDESLLTVEKFNKILKTRIDKI